MAPPVAPQPGRGWPQAPYQGLFPNGGSPALRSTAGRFLANPNAGRRARGNTGTIGDADLLVRCAWCNRIKVGERFVPVDPTIAAHLGERTTHGICPECFERVTRAAAARRPDAA
jgi:hypothetical protein